VTVIYNNSSKIVLDLTTGLIFLYQNLLSLYYHTYSVKIGRSKMTLEFTWGQVLVFYNSSLATHAKNYSNIKLYLILIG